MKQKKIIIIIAAYLKGFLEQRRMSFSFFLAYFFFVLEIITFLCYANEENDVIGGSTKTLKQCSSNLAPARYVEKKKKKQNNTYYVVTIAKLLAPVSFSFCEKPNISICNLLKWARGFYSEHTWFPYCLGSG